MPAARGRRFEALEPRWLMAQAALVEPQFRIDDFSINGTFSYELRSPSDFDYIDKITNGQYVSTAGNVVWTSPTDGTGFFEGKATGAGHDTIVFGGVRRGCSDYAIEDIGRLEFSIDASQTKLKIDSADATSTRYTSYKDLLGGLCPAPNPPWSRFFGGFSSRYNGTFKTSDHTVAISYVETGANPMTVTSPAAAVKWATTTPTDLVLQASYEYSEPQIPDGWISVEQTTTIKPVTFLDPESGQIALTTTVAGKPPTTATPSTPVANVRLFWASSPSDTSGAEIPVTSNLGPVGLYWNSSQLDAVIGGLPAAPPGAAFVRVVISGPIALDSNAGNSSVYLPLGTFEAANATSGPVEAGNGFDGTDSSLLAASDRGDPDIRVLAYNPFTSLEGSVEVFDDSGAFYYYPAAWSPQVEALAAGEIITDKITFLAIKNQQVVDEVTHSIQVVGVNDPPVAETDQAATDSDTPLTLTIPSLLGNDSDPDHGDAFRLTSVGTSSAFGATVRTKRDALTGAILGAEYDPTTSLDLLALAQGTTVVDYVEYSIADTLGAAMTGYVEISVTGVAASLRVLPIATQLVRQDTSSEPITIQVYDPDGDPSDVSVTAEASDGTLIPLSQLVVDGSGAAHALVITPAPGKWGKAIVTVTATDGSSHSSSTSFLVIVGSASDLDLDGASDSDEDGAPQAGDMNGDGVPDRQQPHVASTRSAAGDHYFQLTVEAGGAFEGVHAVASPGHPEPPAGMQLPLGVIYFDTVLNSPGATTTVGFRSASLVPPVNRYLYLTSGDTWKDGMHSLGKGARVYPNYLTIVAQDGGSSDRGAAGDGRISVRAGFATATHPWRGVNPLDVDNDGNIIPQDALIVINEINARGARALPSLPPANLTIPFFFDPSGDNFVAPQDALQIINYLNSGPAKEAEGEQAPTAIRAAELPPARGATSVGLPVAHDRAILADASLPGEIDDDLAALLGDDVAAARRPTRSHPHLARPRDRLGRRPG